MISMKKLSLLAMSVAILSGCSVGQSEFNCSRGDENALCGSSRSIYKATNGELDENTKITYIVDGEVHQTDVDNINELQGKIKNSEKLTSVKKSNKNSNISNGEVISEKSTDQLLFEMTQLDMPVSTSDVMRTKAKVMKIGINNWVDQDDVFHMASMILVDIESRRWNVHSKQNNDSSDSVLPFLAKESATKKKAEATTKKVTGIKSRTGETATEQNQ